MEAADKVTAGAESKALLTAHPAGGDPGGLSALLPTGRAGCSLHPNFLAFSGMIFVSSKMRKNRLHRNCKVSFPPLYR